MRQWVQRAVSILGLAIFSLTTGCAGFFVYPGSTGGGGTTATGDYVYVANGTTNNLAAFAVGTGKLTAVSGSPYSLGFNPRAMAVNPADSILFVAGASGGNGYIAAYAIGANGGLSLLTNNSVGFAYEVSIGISPDGNWLLGLDANGLTVDEYSINSSTGQLTLATGASYTVSGLAATSPLALKFAPNGDYVFVALGTQGDMVYPFDTSSGSLSAPLTLAETAGNSDNALAVSPNNSYLFIARSGTGGGLAVYTIGNGGSLTEVTGSPFAAGDQPFSVAVNTAGTDVYVANQLDSSISGYSVGSGGTLSQLGGSPYTNGSQPALLAADNTGDYLLAASHTGAPDLTMYSFSAGALVEATTIATGSDPTGPIAMATTH